MKRIGKFFIAIVIICLVIVLGVFLGKLVLEKTKAENTVIDFMEAYTNGDADTCGELLYSVAQQDTDSFSELQVLLAQNILYDVQECKKYDDYYMVSLDIENVDFQEILNEIEKNYADADESIIYDEIIKNIKIGKSKRNFVCKVTVLNVGDKMQIMMTDTLSNALFGGLNEYVSSMLYEREY